MFLIIMLDSIKKSQYNKLKIRKIIKKIQYLKIKLEIAFIQDCNHKIKFLAQDLMK
jgi:hypothetical protein